MGSYTTHTTLLGRLREGEGTAWSEFCVRYGDLIRNFARRRSLQEADCDDVMQEVLTILTRSLPGFTYDPSRGRFRSYLKTVTLHVIARRLRQKGVRTGLDEVKHAVADDRHDESVEADWEAEWRQYHLRMAMRTIDAEFNRADRAAFTLYALEGATATQTADEIGISLDQVYQAKSRIVRRLSELIERQIADEG